MSDWTRSVMLMRTKGFAHQVSCSRAGARSNRASVPCSRPCAIPSTACAGHSRSPTWRRPFYDAYWQRRLDLEPDIVTTAPGRARIVAEFVQPGWSVLDLGCGDGSFL